MGNSNETFTLQCAFCGDINEYSEEDLYEDSANGKRVYRDKFCGKCGESIHIHLSNVSKDLSNGRRIVKI